MELFTQICSDKRMHFTSSRGNEKQSFMVDFWLQQAEIDKSASESRRLAEELQQLKSDKGLINELESHIEELRSELGDQEDVILALQHACSVSVEQFCEQRAELMNSIIMIETLFWT